MRIGKLQESILDRSVFKQLHRENKKILCKLKPGMGFQMLDMTDSAGLATTVNVVEGTWEMVGVMAVPRAVNSLVCSGACPVGIMLALILPESLEESDFRRMIHTIDAACAAEGIEIMGGHTQVSTSVSRVLATVTAYGEYPAAGDRFPVTGDGAAAAGARGVYSAAGDGFPVTEAGAGGVYPASGEASQPQPWRPHSFGPRPGQDIIMTRWAGLSGTWLLEKEYHQQFVHKYNPDLADSITRMKDDFCVRKEAALALSYGARTLYDLSEGGVFGGLWEVAVAGNVGLRVDLKKIPLKQETVELCDFVDVNPYQLASMGSLLIGADHGEPLVRLLSDQGIAAAIIGSFTDGNDRVIVNDDEVRYLEPPRGEKKL